MDGIGNIGGGNFGAVAQALGLGDVNNGGGGGIDFSQALTAAVDTPMNNPSSEHSTVSEPGAGEKDTGGEHLVGWGFDELVKGLVTAAARGSESFGIVAVAIGALGLKDDCGGCTDKPLDQNDVEVDGNGNWVDNRTGETGGPTAVEIDENGNWVDNRTGETGGSGAGPNDVEVDGNGNWVDNRTGETGGPSSGGSTGGSGGGDSGSSGGSGGGDTVGGSSGGSGGGSGDSSVPADDTGGSGNPPRPNTLPADDTGGSGGNSGPRAVTALSTFLAGSSRASATLFMPNPEVTRLG
jgi:hypothetical protein